MNTKDLYTLTSSIEEIEDVGATDFHSYLRMFAIRVKRIYPKCSFGYVNVMSGGHHKKNIIHVYHKNSPYTAGVIGYGNFKRNQEGDDTFTVFSRKINNAKYTYGEQCHMRSSKNLDVTERHARTYLRDWAVLEVAKHHQRTVRQHWCDTVDDLGSKIRDRFYALQKDRAAFVTELLTLRTAGHTYVNAEFGSKVDALLEVHDARLEQERERSPSITSVIVQPKDGSNLFHVVRCDNLSNHDAGWMGTDAPYDDNTLPEDIAGKLAMLSMCEPDQWVDNVGYRIDSTVFFVVNASVS